MIKKILAHSLTVLVTIVLTLLATGQLSIGVREGEDSSLEELQSLPYATSVPVSQSDPISGVITHLRDEVQPGLNLVTPRSPRVAGLSETLLVNMEGEIVHQWQALPNSGGHWEYAMISENGDLIVYSTDKYIMRLDWEGNLLWKLEGRYHHDINFDQQGNIYTLSRVDEVIERDGAEYPILNDIVVVISPDGKIISETKLFESLEHLVQERLWRALKDSPDNAEVIEKIRANRSSLEPLIPEGKPSDILHTNNISLLPRDVPGLGKAGDWLISCRTLNTVAVLDAKSKEVIWHWGEEDLLGQHHPVVLDDDKLLIYDNGGIRNYSRVIELDPVSKEIVWEFNRFFSRWGGSSQRLPNGNTLIMADNTGYAFEVTRAGKKVWEYYAHIVGEQGTPTVHRTTVYRIVRITEPVTFEQLQRLLEDSR